MMNRKEAAARVVQYELEFPIAASAKRVWRGLTKSLDKWWLPDFHMLGPKSKIKLDAKAGGNLLETTRNASLLWYTVLESTAEKSLTLAGYCTPRWGGPCTTLLTLELTADTDKTTLKLTDALYGHVTDGQVESLAAGWTRLLNEGLKTWAEQSSPRKRGKKRKAASE